MPRKPKTSAPRVRSTKTIRTSEAIISATVRPQDAVVARFSHKRTDAENLVRRYQKWVKVGVSRNSAGVGQLTIRAFRAASAGGSKSAWYGRRLGLRKSEALRKHAGPLSRKAMQYDDELEEITDPAHPVNAIFRTVNPFQNGFDWIEDVVGGSCLTGNSYSAVVTGKNGWPTELWTLPPQWVRVQPHKVDFLSGYWYGRGTEMERFYEADDIIQFKLPNPRGDPWYGFGDLEACAPDADLSFALSQVALAILDNGIMPGMIFVGEDWTKDQRAEARAHMEREHQGVAKIGRAMFLSGKVKVDKVQIGQYEVELLQGSDDHAREVVAACLDVPLELMTLRPGGLSDGKGKAMYEWQAMSLLPRKRRIEDKLNEKLMPLFHGPLGDDSLVVCIDNPVSEDEVSLEDRATKLFVGNLVPRDEARAMLMLDPVDGDEPVWHAGATAAPMPAKEPADGEQGPPEADAAPAPAGPDVQATALNGAQVTALTDLVARVANGELPLKTVKPMMLISYPSTPEAQIDALIAALTGFEAPKPEPPQLPPAAEGPPREPNGDGGGGTPTKALVRPDASPSAPPAAAPSVYPHLFDPIDLPPEFKDDDFTRRFQATIRGWLDDQTPEIQEHVGYAVQAGDVGLVRDLLSGNPTKRAEFAALVEPFSIEALVVGNGTAMSELATVGHVGDARPWTDAPPVRAIEWARANAVRLSESTLATVDARVAATVQQTISEQIAQGLTTGETVAQVQARVADVMGPSSTQFAAERIARTETARATVQGRIETYKESGEVAGVRWLLSGNPCPECVDLGGKVVAMGEPFATSDYGPVYGPPLHPQCGCDCAPVYKEEGP